MRRVLILKLGALGDVLRTTSLLRPLIVKHRNPRITWATSRAALPLLQGNPLVHEALAWGPRAERLLKRSSYDLVLSLEEDEGLARLLPRLEAREVVGVVWTGSGLGFTPSSAPYYRMSLLNRGPDGSMTKADSLKKANRLAYVEMWRRILKLPRLPRKDMRPVLVLSPQDRAAGRALLRRHPALAQGPLIGLNPGAGTRWPAKRLSPERSAALCCALHRRFGVPVVLLGGPDERGINRGIVRKARGSAVDAGTGHSLKSFAGIVDLCGAVVTADTLTLHVANALGKPVAVFVGPTSAAELDLFGTGSVLRPPRPCRDFYKARCSLNRSCLDRIGLQSFVSTVRTLLRVGTISGKAETL